MRMLIGTAMLALAMPAAAQKVTIDYARDVDFDAIETFQYVETEETAAGNPMMADRILEALKAKLREGGLREVQDSPDIFITYHMAAQEAYQLDTTGFGYAGYGPGWRRWGVGSVTTTTTATSYTEGTLILDAYDAAENKMIWRGTGTVVVASKPEKQMRQIQKILDKLGGKWKKILENQGK